MSTYHECLKQFLDLLIFDLVKHLREKDIADIVVAHEVPVQDVVEGEAGKLQTEGLSHTTNISDNHKDEKSTEEKNDVTQFWTILTPSTPPSSRVLSLGP